MLGCSPSHAITGKLSSSSHAIIGELISRDLGLKKGDSGSDSRGSGLGGQDFVIRLNSLSSLV